MSTVISTRRFSPNIWEVFLGESDAPICILMEPMEAPGMWYFIPVAGALYSAELLAVIGRRLEELNLERPANSAVN